MTKNLWRLKWRDAEEEKPTVDELDMESEQVIVIKTIKGSRVELYDISKWYVGPVPGNGCWLVRRDEKVVKWAYLPDLVTQNLYLNLYSEC